MYKNRTWYLTQEEDFRKNIQPILSVMVWWATEQYLDGVVVGWVLKSKYE